MSKIFKVTLIVIGFLMLMPEAYSQCAMCRATVENNVSNGEIGIGAGLNFGIMYLFVMPYLAIGLIGFLWYKKSKSNAKKEQGKRHYQF